MKKTSAERERAGEAGPEKSSSFLTAKHRSAAADHAARVQAVVDHPAVLEFAQADLDGGKVTFDADGTPQLDGHFALAGNSQAILTVCVKARQEPAAR